MVRMEAKTTTPTWVLDDAGRGDVFWTLADVLSSVTDQTLQRQLILQHGRNQPVITHD